MLVTLQLPIQITNIFHSLFDMHLCVPLWKRFLHHWH